MKINRAAAGMLALNLVAIAAVAFAKGEIAVPAVAALAATLAALTPRLFEEAK